MDIFAKDKGRKYTDKQIERSNDLAERMMSSEDFDGDWEKAFALSRWMMNKYPKSVKIKPDKPHAEYKPKKKKKKKADIELYNHMVLAADELDSLGLSKEADVLDGMLKKFAQEFNDGYGRENEYNDGWSQQPEETRCRIKYYGDQNPDLNLGEEEGFYLVKDHDGEYEIVEFLSDDKGEAIEEAKRICGGKGWILKSLNPVI